MREKRLIISFVYQCNFSLVFMSSLIWKRCDKKKYNVVGPLHGIHLQVPDLNYNYMSAFQVLVGWRPKSKRIEYAYSRTLFLRQILQNQYLPNNNNSLLCKFVNLICKWKLKGKPCVYLNYPLLKIAQSFPVQDFNTTRILKFSPQIHLQKSKNLGLSKHLNI